MEAEDEEEKGTVQAIQKKHNMIQGTLQYVYIAAHKSKLNNRKCREGGGSLCLGCIFLDGVKDLACSRKVDYVTTIDPKRASRSIVV